MTFVRREPTGNLRVVRNKPSGDIIHIEQEWIIIETLISDHIARTRTEWVRVEDAP
jgi:hypothetical protein